MHLILFFSSPFWIVPRCPVGGLLGTMCMIFNIVKKVLWIDCWLSMCVLFFC